MSARVFDFDPLEQVITRQMWGRRWRAGQLEIDEKYILKERFYFRNEVLLMLERAGFVYPLRVPLPGDVWRRHDVRNGV